MTNLNRAIDRMKEQICAVLDQRVHSIWLYGSVVLDDFRPGWSDIDLLVLAGGRITERQAGRLVGLRQALLEAEPGNPYYRCFEGIIADADEYRAGTFSRLVYWGTSGERITDRCQRDVFSLYQLAEYGRCVCGENDRSFFKKPSAGELREAVRRHYESIRRYAAETNDTLYSCGWLLDIARCVHTLRYGDVIAKTQAGVWALSEHLFEEEEPLRKALRIRRDPAAFKEREDVKRWLRGLGPAVQRYADVLERELYRTDPCGAFSLPFRKAKRISVPEGMTILREDRFDPARCGGRDEPYFKLVHRLRNLESPRLPARYRAVRCGAEELARHIGECYARERVTADELRACEARPGFDPDLRLAVIDTANGRIAASGIAEADAGIGEGTLEWIQVSPEYRRQGLGRYVVLELLRRLRGKADFVTVSGKINNPCGPLALYRSCGFTDCVVWHIVRNGGA